MEDEIGNIYSHDFPSEASDEDSDDDAFEPQVPGSHISTDSENDDIQPLYEPGQRVTIRNQGRGRKCGISTSHFICQKLGRKGGRLHLEQQQDEHLHKMC